MKLRHMPAAFAHSPLFLLRYAPKMFAHTFRGSTIRSFLGLEDEREHHLIAGRRFDDLGVMRLSRWFEMARGAQKAWPEPNTSPL